ncbi:MAG: hypothetical protein ABI413_01715 [Ktedonobacteraceae bacterium]
MSGTLRLNDEGFWEWGGFCPSFSEAYLSRLRKRIQPGYNQSGASYDSSSVKEPTCACIASVLLSNC